MGFQYSFRAGTGALPLRCLAWAKCINFACPFATVFQKNTAKTSFKIPIFPFLKIPLNRYIRFGNVCILSEFGRHGV
jgi:hypothetical protein